jgi:flagellar assembly protein FliH
MTYQSEGRAATVDAVSDLLARGERPVSRLSFIPIEEEVPEQPPRDIEQELRTECEQKMREAAETARLQAETSRTQGFAEAQRAFEAELETRLAQERNRLDQLRLEFARDRQRFFAAAEGQVVRLALAVARKVLTHEANSEGLHLRSTVKSALARVQDGGTTTLRVPENETEAWRAMFQGGTAGKVDVVGDLRLQPGDCVLETTLGRVELGIDVQMEEVERGFGELLQQQHGQ